MERVSINNTLIPSINVLTLKRTFVHNMANKNSEVEIALKGKDEKKRPVANGSSER